MLKYNTTSTCRGAMILQLSIVARVWRSDASAVTNNDVMIFQLVNLRSASEEPRSCRRHSLLNAIRLRNTYTLCCTAGTLASPARGHCGTCPLGFQQFFLLHFGTSGPRKLYSSRLYLALYNLRSGSWFACVGLNLFRDIDSGPRNGLLFVKSTIFPEIP